MKPWPKEFIDLIESAHPDAPARRCQSVAEHPPFSLEWAMRRHAELEERSVSALVTVHGKSTHMVWVMASEYEATVVERDLEIREREAVERRCENAERRFRAAACAAAFCGSIAICWAIQAAWRMLQ